MKRKKIFAILQRLAFVAVCLATLAGLFYAIESWRGKRAFLAHKQAVEAKGDSLDWKTFVPPPVPDDQNLAMTPLFKGLNDYERTANGVVWHNQSSTERLKKLETIFQLTRGGKPDPGSASLEKNELLSLAAWQEFFGQNTNLPQPSPGQAPADFILNVLSSFEPELQELKAAAAARPLARFPVHYEDNISCLLPHIAKIKNVVRYLNLHATACLELGRVDEAFEDLKLAYTLSDSIKTEPFLVCRLVRIACMGISTQIVKEGLARQRWKEPHLKWIQDYCHNANLLQEIAQALRAERSFCIGGLEMMRRGQLPMQVILSQEGDSSGTTTWPVAHLYPGGWLYQNMVTVSTFHERFLASSIDPEAHRVYPDKAESVDPALAQMKITPFNIFAKLLTPALLKSAHRAARWQTALDHAALGSALERYRQAHQNFPETLDALSPQFIAKQPTDIITGQPYRYRKEGNQYLLYSVGWNEQDDNGHVFAQGTATSVDSRKGDWVWSLTPTPPMKFK